MGSSMSSCYSAEVEVQETTQHVEAKALETTSQEIKEEEERVEEKEKPVEASTEEAPEPAKESLVALTTDTAVLVITFEAKGTGKETELVFKTRPLPFDCKQEASCFCCGTSGRVAVKKVDPKKAQDFYDLKPGMLIKKLDGAELSKDLDWPDFEKTLAAKTKELKLEEVPTEEAPKETTEQTTKATKEEAAEVPKEEARMEAAGDATEAAKEETTLEAPQETTGEAKGTAAETPTETA
eukprot:TRINITY_DN3323_c3_g1_i1.p1 TRINITY_DN3323_c3_g1~~TRINITY_DN3323_c3_g1_i1.p1  ORF type:complete len:267 (+),score=103.44 TRINITY_DN3323_c3_g1_i1:86-802(+)